MNQFKTRTVVNDATGIVVDGDGTLKPYVLRIPKVLTIPVTEICGDVFKRVGHDAVLEEYTVKFNAVDAGETKLVWRFTVVMNQVGAYHPIFQNASTRSRFELPVEIAVAPSETAENVAKKVEKALKMVFAAKGTKLFGIKRTTDTLVLTAPEEHTHFLEVKLDAVSESLTGFEAHEPRALAQAEVTKEGKEGFGTARWIFKTLRIPTIANTHATALHRDELPIPGVVYTQVTIQQLAKRPELGGVNAVNEEVASKTTHVLYMAPAALSALEAALNEKATVKAVNDPA